MEQYRFDPPDAIQKGMIQVIRKRDILRVRLLSKSEKQSIERGGPDIVAVTPSGQKLMLTRAQLAKNYSYLNGKKISLAGWRAANEYVVYRPDNTQAFAMLVPLNCTITVNGKSANTDIKKKKGDYIVALAGPNGTIDESTLGVITASLFKKMYYMPPNDVITRNKGKGHKLLAHGPGGKEERERTSESLKISKQPIKIPRNTTKIQRPQVYQAPQTSQVSQTDNFDFGDQGIYNQQTAESRQTVDTSSMNIHRINTQTPRQNQNISRPQQPRPSTQQTQQTQQVKKYLAVGRLLNANGVLVGFIIQNSSGATKNVTIAQMKTLCSNHLITNVMLSTNADTGKAYLRGNNIRIDALPSYTI